MAKTAENESHTYICLDHLGFVGIQNGKDFWKWIHSPTRARLLYLHGGRDRDGAQFISNIILGSIQGQLSMVWNATGEIWDNVLVSTNATFKYSSAIFTGHHQPKSGDGDGAASPAATGSPPCTFSASVCLRSVLECIWAQSLGFETELVRTAPVFFSLFQLQVCPQLLHKMTKITLTESIMLAHEYKHVELLFNILTAHRATDFPALCSSSYFWQYVFHHLVMFSQVYCPFLPIANFFLKLNFHQATWGSYSIS